MRTVEFTVTEEFDGKRVSAFLRSFGFSTTILKHLKKDDRLQINGVRAKTVDIVHTGDKVTARMEDANSIPANPDLDVKTVYEDADVVIYDKPCGMPVHPSIMHYTDTLANYFAAQYPETAFRSVSRLDRNTSGLVMAAKNKLAAARLAGDPAFRPKKLYYAIAEGNVTEKFGVCGEIIAPIARKNDSIINRVVREDGKYAHTVFKVIESNEKMSFLEISLVTGRTHQIRVHFSYMGFPLYGDELYGGDMSLIKRQALHCGQMTFIHPMTREKVSVRSEIPEDMKTLLEKLKG